MKRGELRRSVVVKHCYMKAIAQRVLLLTWALAFLAAAGLEGLAICSEPDGQRTIGLANRQPRAGAGDVTHNDTPRSNHGTGESCGSCVDIPLGWVTNNRLSRERFGVKPMPTRLLEAADPWRTGALSMTRSSRFAIARRSSPAHLAHLSSIVLLI